MFRQLIIKYLLVVQLLLLLFGIILILLSAMAKTGSQLNLILFSLGTSFIASTLLSLLNSLFGTDTPTVMEQKLEYKRKVYDAGLEAIFYHGDMSFFEKLDHAHSIDLMYTTAKAISHHYGHEIMQAIEIRGCKVRLVISDPKNIIWKDTEICSAAAPGIDIVNEIKDTLAYLSFLIDDLKKKTPSLKSGSIEIKMHPYMPTSSIAIIDGKLVRHIPYLPFFGVAESPKYDITKERGGELFAIYQKTFERIWNQSETVLKVEWPLSTKP